MRRLVVAFAACAAGMLMSSAAYAAAVVARVDVAQQKMVVSHYGKVIHEWVVSTGAEEHGGTPRGEYKPYRMHKMWHSRTYNGEEMPFSVFYDRGWAVHGTKEVDRLGEPISHGCVRLDPEHAKIFYTLVNQVGPGNTRIIVEN
jgi:lipoprotein-anchoring transpeptidase ErfK/SrfK